MESVNSRVAVYPGSFDPITMGHIDLIERALTIFDRVIVAVANNPRKNPLFPTDMRERLIRESVARFDRVEVTTFSGLLVEHMEQLGVRVLIRGRRALSDFGYEFQFSHMNKRMSPGIETVFLMTSERYFYISSSIIKEVVRFGGDVSGLVPPPVESALKSKFGKNSIKTKG